MTVEYLAHFGVFFWLKHALASIDCSFVSSTSAEDDMDEDDAVMEMEVVLDPSLRKHIIEAFNSKFLLQLVRHLKASEF